MVASGRKKHLVLQCFRIDYLDNQTTLICRKPVLVDELDPQK